MINNPRFFLSNRLWDHLFDWRITIISRWTFLDMYNVLEHILNNIFWLPFYQLFFFTLCNVMSVTPVLQYYTWTAMQYSVSFSIQCDLDLYEGTILSNECYLYLQVLNVFIHHYFFLWSIIKFRNNRMNLFYA